jgi:Luciferase-like monooxygenase
MAVGIIVPLPAYTLNPAFIASKAEALGFESIWYHEHPILPVDSASPFPATGGEIPWTYRHFSEPYISLAMAAAVTSKIKLATGITLVTERVVYLHPAGNSVARKSGTIPPFHHWMRGALPWYRICFSTSCCSWDSCGCASCCLGGGPTTAPHLA